MLVTTERRVLRLRRGLWPETLAGLGNFVLGEANSIDFRAVWASHLNELSPFCIDFENNQVVFVRVAGGVDLSASPFYCQAQRRHAIKIYSLIQISYNERVESIEGLDTGGFCVKTDRRSLDARTVLLTIGRRGTPRKLGVPGEEQSKVVYRVIDAQQFRQQHVLVVGGGDSALEAATSIAAEPGTTVTICYRSAAFSRAKPKNRALAEAMEAAGKLQILFNSNVVSISERSVDVDVAGQQMSFPNDAVVVSAGGILPSAFLKTVGIHVETKWGTE